MILQAEFSHTGGQLLADLGSFQNISDGGYERGRQEEYDAFWDAFQQKGSRTDYSHAFRGAGWTDESFKPKHPLLLAGSAESMCAGAAFTEIPVAVDFSRCNNIYYCFDHCSNLVRLPRLDLSEVRTANFGFGYCLRLEEIQCLVFSENTVLTANTFQGIANLKHLTVEGTVNTMIVLQYASGLTNESVQSIIEHLKDLTGGETKTLRFHANVGAALTDAQKACVTAKNWTLVY